MGERLRDVGGRHWVGGRRREVDESGCVGHVGGEVLIWSECCWLEKKRIFLASAELPVLLDCLFGRQGCCLRWKGQGWAVGESSGNV